MPIARVVTPNLPEAELLLGHPVADRGAMDDACTELLASGARAVLLKGGHLQDGGDVIDLLADSTATHAIRHPRLALDAHGTGCTLASAIAANLALGIDLLPACRQASDYVHRALLGGYRPGRGDVLVLDHFGAARPSLEPR